MVGVCQRPRSIYSVHLGLQTLRAHCVHYCCIVVFFHTIFLLLQWDNCFVGDIHVSYNLFAYVAHIFSRIIADEPCRGGLPKLLLTPSRNLARNTGLLALTSSGGTYANRLYRSIKDMKYLSTLYCTPYMFSGPRMSLLKASTLP